MHSVQEYRVTLYLITQPTHPLRCDVILTPTTISVCRYGFINVHCRWHKIAKGGDESRQTSVFFLKSSLRSTFLLVRTDSSYGFWNMPEKWVTSVLSVRLPLTWLPGTNSTETTSETSKWLSTGSSSSPPQQPLDSWGQLAARPIYWSCAWAQACDLWSSNDRLSKG